MPGFYDAAREFFARKPISSAKSPPIGFALVEQPPVTFRIARRTQLLSASSPTGAEFHGQYLHHERTRICARRIRFGGDYVAV